MNNKDNGITMMNNKDNGITMMNNDDEESNNISKPNKKFQDSEEEEEEEDAKILDDDDDENLVLSKSFNESTTKHDSSYLEGSSSDVGGDGGGDDNDDADGQAPNGNLCGYKIRLIIFGIAFVLGFVLCFVKIDGDGQITQTAAIASKFRFVFEILYAPFSVPYLAHSAFVAPIFGFQFGWPHCG